MIKIEDRPIRIGVWDKTKGSKNAFSHLGYYVGPSLGCVEPNAFMNQELKEDILSFRVVQLLRPDRKTDRIETVFLLENYVPSMWKYEDWEPV